MALSGAALQTPSLLFNSLSRDDLPKFVHDKHVDQFDQVSVMSLKGICISVSGGDSIGWVCVG